MLDSNSYYTCVVGFVHTTRYSLLFLVLSFFTPLPSLPLPSLPLPSPLPLSPPSSPSFLPLSRYLGNYLHYADNVIHCLPTYMAARLGYRVHSGRVFDSTQFLHAMEGITVLPHHLLSRYLGRQYMTSCLLYCVNSYIYWLCAKCTGNIAPLTSHRNGRASIARKNVLQEGSAGGGEGERGEGREGRGREGRGVQGKVKSNAWYARNQQHKCNNYYYQATASFLLYTINLVQKTSATTEKIHNHHIFHYFTHISNGSLYISCVADIPNFSTNSTILMKLIHHNILHSRMPPRMFGTTAHSTAAMNQQRTHTTWNTRSCSK